MIGIMPSNLCFQAILEHIFSGRALRGCCCCLHPSLAHGNRQGSEILGHFDNALSITEVGDEIEVAFDFFTDGEILDQDEFCGDG